jgi:hypothetical protein
MLGDRLSYDRVVNVLQLHAAKAGHSAGPSTARPTGAVSTLGAGRGCSVHVMSSAPTAGWWLKTRQSL